MPALTKQQIFEKVCRHLARQAAPSVRHKPDDPEPDCLYRGPKGLRCAVGCLIPDNLYRPTMEGYNVSDLAKFHPELPHLRRHTNILTKMQYIHDSQKPDQWPAALEVLAKEHKLTMPATVDWSKCKAWKESSR